MKIRYIIAILGLMFSFVSIQADENIWEYDPYAYQYDMSVYATIKVNGEVASPTQYSLAAFYGNECRGVAVAQEINSSYYYYLRIRSNSSNGENITFRLYDKQTKKEMGAGWGQTTLTFNSNDRIGYPSSPYVLEFKQPTHHNVTILPSSNGSIDGEGGVVESGKEITLTAVPDEGYEFTDWTNGETKNPYTFQVTEDMEIGANFRPKKFQVSYLIDGKTIAIDSVPYMSDIVPVSAPEKEGYTFEGWSEVPQKMPARDIIVTGHYVVNVYAIKYFIDDVEYHIDSISYGSPITLIESPQKTGYTFSGWSDAPDLMPAKDITVTGNYIVNVYAIRYFVDDVEYYTDSLSYGSPITLIESPQKTGYTFSGWSDVPDLMPDKDVRVDGSFKLIDQICTPQTISNSIVDVYSLDGKIIIRRILYNEALRKLKDGMYIINGKGIHIGK